MAQPKKSKRKPPSIRVLKHLLEAETLWRKDLMVRIEALNKENFELKKAQQQRIDTSMIDARTKLANALGQMCYAQAEAIKFIIGKEVL